MSPINYPVFCDGSRIIFPGASLDLKARIWMPDDRAAWLGELLLSKWLGRYTRDITAFPDPIDRGGAVIVVDEWLTGQRWLIRVQPDAVVKARVALHELMPIDTIRFMRMEANGVLIINEHLIHTDNRVGKFGNPNRFRLVGDEVREVPDWVFQTEKRIDPDNCHILYIDDESAVLHYIEQWEKHPDSWDWAVGFRVVSRHGLVYDAFSAKAIVMPDGFWATADTAIERSLIFGLRGEILERASLESLGVSVVHELTGTMSRDGWVVVMSGARKDGQDASFVFHIRERTSRVFRGIFYPLRWTDVGDLRVLIGRDRVALLPKKGVDLPKTFVGGRLSAIARWGDRIHLWLASGQGGEVIVLPGETVIPAVRFHANPYEALIQTDSQTLLMMPLGDPDCAEKWWAGSDVRSIEATENGFLVRFERLREVFIHSPTKVSAVDFEIINP